MTVLLLAMVDGALFVTMNTFHNRNDSSCDMVVTKVRKINPRKETELKIKTRKICSGETENG